LVAPISLLAAGELVSVKVFDTRCEVDPKLDRKEWERFLAVRYALD
jgi:hypothetical protein